MRPFYFATYTNGPKCQNDNKRGKGNMNIKVRYLTIIATGMLMVTSPAASEGAQVVVGAGGASCGNFIATIEDDKTFRNTFFSGHKVF